MVIVEEDGDEDLDLESQSCRDIKLPSLDPSQFYSTKGRRDGAASDSSSCSAEVYQIFPRQEHAFQFFDSFEEEDEMSDSVTVKKKQKKNLKIFSLESLREGRRRFVVADMDTFIRKYSGASSRNR